MDVENIDRRFRKISGKKHIAAIFEPINWCIPLNSNDETSGKYT
jgi:hypothetical protein